MYLHIVQEQFDASNRWHTSLIFDTNQCLHAALANTYTHSLTHFKFRMFPSGSFTNGTSLNPYPVRSHVKCELMIRDFSVHVQLQFVCIFILHYCYHK